mmetsp:Transcript_79538/g.165177  ORF Transcript_79538/g.165177 Transcript_79538/m.165177 type:complete len:89 (+) Transcript_79538:721-987(+)
MASTRANPKMVAKVAIKMTEVMMSLPLKRPSESIKNGKSHLNQYKTDQPIVIVSTICVTAKSRVERTLAGIFTQASDRSRQTRAKIPM